MEIIVTIGKLEQIEKYQKAGATAFIFCDEFNGTRAPSKFSRNELVMAINQTHSLNCKAAVFMNRIYTDNELENAKEYMLFLKENNIDLIYYNDPAIYMIADEMELVDHLVYEPDTLMTNSRDMQFILSQGVNHAVLSTEITLDEMKTMVENVKGNTEAILFGYLNMSYSKRHLIQSYCDEIGIKNTCTDKMDCTLIESTRNGRMPILEDQQGTHIYTDYILDGFEEAILLKESGLQAVRLDSLFIDDDVINDAILIMSGKSELTREEFELKYKKYTFSKGYMYQKTNLVK